MCKCKICFSTNTKKILIFLEGAAVALEVLQYLVQHSPKPLSSALIDTAFPAACHCILNSEDHTILQNGGELMRIYISTAAEQVTAHRNNEGRTGLEYILQIIAQLLNPRVNHQLINNITFIINNNYNKNRIW